MTSVAKDVAAYMDRDIVLSEALARGIVNLRALSRWLIKTQRWTTSETAVLSALRRRSTAPLVNHFSAAREVLAHSRLNSRAGISLLTVTRSRVAQERLASLCHSLDYSKSETMRVIDSEGAIFVAIDDENMGRAQTILGQDLVQSTERGITALTIVTPEASIRTPGILSLLSTTLALHGINIVHCGTAGRENVFLLMDEDAVLAYQALAAFCGRTDPTGVSPPMVTLSIPGRPFTPVPIRSAVPVARVLEKAAPAVGAKALDAVNQGRRGR